MVVGLLEAALGIQGDKSRCCLTASGQYHISPECLLVLRIRSCFDPMHAMTCRRLQCVSRARAED